MLDDARRVVPEPGDVELELRHGIPARELEDLARERGSDLIALGTSRPGRLRRALTGSLADELAASSHRLVMLVPHDVAQPALRREAALAAVPLRRRWTLAHALGGEHAGIHPRHSTLGVVKHSIHRNPLELP